MDNPMPFVPYEPTPAEFPGFMMPSSVPAGLRLELSRSRILDGQEQVFEEWMDTLNNRYDECEATLPAQRAVFEATFKHVEADGSAWMYHLSLVGEGGAGLDIQQDIDATHLDYAKRVKAPGWQELEPKFLLMPDRVRVAMQDHAQNPRPGGESGPRQ